MLLIPFPPKRNDCWRTADLLLLSRNVENEFETKASCRSLPEVVLEELRNQPEMVSIGKVRTIWASASNYIRGDSP